MLSSGLVREYLSGSLASSFTYLIFSPLEVIKTRLQIQDAPGWTRVYRNGLLSAVRDGLRQDGVWLFWSHGLAAGIGRDFFYSGVRTGMYPTVRDAISTTFRPAGAAGEASLLEKIAAGATTGSVGSGLANAFDVVRVRMTAEGGVVDARSGLLRTGLRAGHQPRWTSSLDCLLDTARREGVVRGLLLRGVTASMSRAGLLTAAQMSSYDHTKTVAKRNGACEGAALHISAALLSGFAAALACNPADVLKSRVMSASARTGVAGSTMAWHTVKHIVKHEGIKGFYRGFLPQYCRLGPTILIQLPVAEALRQQLGVRAI